MVGYLIGGLVLILLGIGHTLFPEKMWELERWRSNATEPSDLFLLSERVGGAVALVAGVVLIVLGILEAVGGPG